MDRRLHVAMLCGALALAGAACSEAEDPPVPAPKAATPTIEEPPPPVPTAIIRVRDGDTAKPVRNTRIRLDGTTMTLGRHAVARVVPRARARLAAGH